jgi:putative hydrolase of the HAD superfamily
MPRDSFRHIRHWVFDLDNTLYPPSDRLFDQIEVRMSNYVSTLLEVDLDEADRMRSDYWARFGTTLSGLMHEHSIDPAPYLEHVHDINLDHMQPDFDLRRFITRLPGQKIVYTNGTAPYARRVLAARGLNGVFDGVFGITEAGFRPKPQRAAFESIFDQSGVDPASAAMFEDDPRNLTAPHAMGLQTVHVAPQPIVTQHIHHHTDDLAGFLSQLV